MVELLGDQQPRVEIIPAGDEHPRWNEIQQFIAATGTTLDPWQTRVLWASLLRRGSIWAAFVVGVCAPRQNGKNGILEMRELVGALILGEKLLIHSAHLADTSKEAFRRLEDLLDENAWLAREVRHIWRTNGHEALEFKNGNRIRFRTRTRGGGRGFSGSPVIFDESMFLSEISMGAMLPVISAQPDPQVWHLGSAVDQTIHEEGVVFARVREQALDGDPDRLAYFEWSLDAAAPEQIEPSQAANPSTWARTNPAFGIRITPEYIREEQRVLDTRTFAVERLGVGDWPRTDAISSIFDLQLWEALTDSQSVVKEPFTLAFDVNPDRTMASIALAGKRSDGLLHVEVVDRRAGTGWIVQRLAELHAQHKPQGIICDSVGPARSLVADLERRDIRVTEISTPEHGQACAMLFDAVEQGAMRHLGQPDLTSAVKGAAQRTLGDAWAWSRRNSSTDISPLVACTFASWLVLTQDAKTPMLAFS